MTSPQPSLPLGSTPSRRPSLAFSAEPALALRGVDSGPIVELPTGDMVDAGAVSADIALDRHLPPAASFEGALAPASLAPRRQSQGGTKSPRHIPRRPARASDSSAM